MTKVCDAMALLSQHEFKTRAVTGAGFIAPSASQDPHNNNNLTIQGELIMRTKNNTSTKSESKEVKAPKLTKKQICIEMVSAKGGATIDEMAAACKTRGLGKDLAVNKTTCSLWMSKIGFVVQRNKETGKYARKVAAKAPKATKAPKVGVPAIEAAAPATL